MRGSQPWKTLRSQSLRSQQISAEEKLWSYPRNRRLGGFKFVQQEPIDIYYVDFLCRELRLVVEVDGATHCEIHELDADVTRAARLVQLGYRVYRASNTNGYDNIDGTLDELLALLEGRLC